MGCRTCRAHSRPNPYMSSPRHTEMILTEKEQIGPKQREQIVQKKKRYSRRNWRNKNLWPRNKFCKKINAINFFLKKKRKTPKTSYPGEQLQWGEYGEESDHMRTPVPAFRQVRSGSLSQSRPWEKWEWIGGSMPRPGVVDENSRPGGCRGSPQGRTEGLGSADQPFQI